MHSHSENTKQRLISSQQQQQKINMNIQSDVINTHRVRISHNRCCQYSIVKSVNIKSECSADRLYNTKKDKMREKLAKKRSRKKNCELSCVFSVCVVCNALNILKSESICHVAHTVAILAVLALATYFRYIKLKWRCTHTHKRWRK